ncbi:C4-dicarboxylate transport sensor protein DctB [compost metagenome]|jgi:two-component system C4-dicarboxylate transport sensor histidine kinase DctB
MLFTSHRLRQHRPWVLLAAAWVVVSVVTALAAGSVARREAEAELARQADAAAALHAAVLRSELEKHRSLPIALAGDPDIVRLLSAPDRPHLDRVNRKLEGLATHSRAAVIYAIDLNGVGRAASNWMLPTSFIGSNYNFRPYFLNALKHGQAEFFALGTVSGRPGLYLARRVNDAAGRALGVVVVKVEFDALEAEWRASGEPAYVVDSNGVTLITSAPEWRFRKSRLLDERGGLPTAAEPAGASRSLPFATPAEGPPRLIEARIAGADERLWMHAQVATSTPGWTLHLLAPSRGAVDTATATARALGVMIVTLMAGLVGLVLRRRQQAGLRAQQEVEMRLQLERSIDARTRELQQANAALSRQVEERQRAEASRELLRDQLVQASKLAALGQIAAGVAHEINQPVAAIQTQAETATVYLDRAEADAAHLPNVRQSLTRIADLTQRIGAITHELRGFSRKAETRLEAVRIGDAIDGALLLVGGRLRQGGVRLVRSGGDDLIAYADCVRLEQVIINLLQNAAEALDQTEDPTITVKVAVQGRRVILTVSDNGPGIAPEIRESLFIPFTTSRPQGLGLGLIICRDIVAGFGGELRLGASRRGAAFVVSLRNAA